MLCTSVAYMESTTESSVYIIIMICKLHTTHFYIGKIYRKLGSAFTFFCGGRGSSCETSEGQWMGPSSNWLLSPFDTALPVFDGFRAIWYDKMF